MILERIRRWCSGCPGSFLGHKVAVVKFNSSPDNWSGVNARMACSHCHQVWDVFGSSTVWRWTDSGERCPTEWESKLGAAWSLARRLMWQQQEAPEVVRRWLDTVEFYSLDPLSMIDMDKVDKAMRQIGLDWACAQSQSRDPTT